MQLIYVSVLFLLTSQCSSSPLCVTIQQFNIIISDYSTVNSKLNIYHFLISRQLFPYRAGLPPPRHFVLSSVFNHCQKFPSPPLLPRIYKFLGKDLP